MGNFISGAYTPHPNSLMFNGIPIFWPFKVYWFFRKVLLIANNSHLVRRNHSPYGLPHAP